MLAKEQKIYKLSQNVSWLKLMKENAQNARQKIN